MVLQQHQKLNMLLILHNHEKKIVLSLYNGSNSFLLANTTKIYKSKQIF